MKQLTQGEVEAQILQAVEALEESTENYAILSDEAATAEADYKLRHARAIVTLSDVKATAAEKGARADLTSAEELRAWKIAEARRQASKEHLLSLRARLDALRSLSANIRAQT